jgi:hypothetical protein
MLRHFLKKRSVWQAINVSLLYPINQLSVFVVQYNMNVIHAVDGLNNGIVLVPVNGNYLLKIYKGSQDCYSDIVLPMLELQQLMLFHS